MVMKDGFKSLARPSEARKLLLERCDPLERHHKVTLDEADGRVAAEDVTASQPSPAFRRAAMDGYAVNASDTFGGSTNSPIRLSLVDDFEPGGRKASPIHTGAALPEGADAVLMFEDAEEVGRYVDVFSPVAPGENVSPIGEDVEEGETLIHRGERLTPSQLGLLRSLVIEEVPVVDRPRIGIVPTGEELVEPGRQPQRGETVQSNGIMIEKYVERWGGNPQVRPVLSDRPERIESGLDWGMKFDAVSFTGGSSVGRRDRLVEVLRRRGEVLVHGVAIQPGKPVALAIVEGVPVIALPGYPVATLVDAYFFLRPLIDRLLGSDEYELRGRVTLGRKIASSLGRLSVVRVAVKEGKAYPLRVSGSGVLSSVTRSDGFVLVPEDSEGIAEGVEVDLYYWR